MSCFRTAFCERLAGGAALQRKTFHRPFYRAVREDVQLRRWTVEIVFIDDGSQDQTSRIAKRIVQRDPLVVLLTLSRNFGKEAALFAGIEYATGDAVIPVDVDLQDPISVIAQLIEAWGDGAEVVLENLPGEQASTALRDQKRLEA